MRGDFMAGAGSIRQIFCGPDIEDCDWRRIILGLKIDRQNWSVIEEASSQFRSWLKSLQHAAHELQPRQLSSQRSGLHRTFSQAQEKVPFSPISANALRRC